MGGFGNGGSAGGGAAGLSGGDMFSLAAIGLNSGMQIGSGIATAQYNAAASKAAAKNAEQQSGINADLIRRQYTENYRELVSRNERQAAENQVVALKRGITGASADAAMQSYAARGQRNLERLYSSTAMRTGGLSLQYGQRIQQLSAVSRQYEWNLGYAVAGGMLSGASTALRIGSMTATGGTAPADSMNRYG